jgi:hypothetical protein
MWLLSCSPNSCTPYLGGGSKGLSLPAFMNWNSSFDWKVTIPFNIKTEFQMVVMSKYYCIQKLKLDKACERPVFLPFLFHFKDYWVLHFIFLCTFTEFWCIILSDVKSDLFYKFIGSVHMHVRCFDALYYSFVYKFYPCECRVFASTVFKSAMLFHMCRNMP